MHRTVITLVIAATAALAGCSSDDDNGNNNGGGDGGGNGTPPIVDTLDALVSLPANSRPVDDGLDQVNADLLNAFGDANSTPVMLDDNETVATFIKKREAAL